jgi:hypothetical protein
MRSQALSLATVAILAGLIGSFEARAENLEAGKTPQKIFNDTCSACHRTSRGLLKTVPASTLPGFLRQHYTTSADMASALSAYLLSGGGATERVAEPKQGKKDAKQEGASAAAAQSGAEPAAQGKRGKQAARTDGEGRPAEATPDGAKQSPKSKRGKKGAPVEETVRQELPKDAGKEPVKDQSRAIDSEQVRTEPKATEPKPEPARTEQEKTQPAKTEAAKPDEAKPATATMEPAASAPDKTTAIPADSTGPANDNKPVEVKPKEASIPAPAAPTSTPRPARKPMLTLPGFPPPVPEPDDTAAPATAATPPAPAPAEPAKPDEPKTAPPAGPPKAEAPRAEAPSADAPKVDAPKDQKDSQAADPAKANAAKSVADQATESSSAEKPDSAKPDIEEESHGPGQAAPPKAVSTATPRKKRTSSTEQR